MKNGGMEIGWEKGKGGERKREGRQGGREYR